MKLKKTRYVWLDTELADEKLENNKGNYYSFTFNLDRNLEMSKNAVLSVCGFQYFSRDSNGNAVHTPIVIRCRNIPPYQYIDSNNTDGAIIHMTKTPQSKGIDYDEIYYDIGDSIYWKNITLIVGNITDPQNGMLPSDILNDSDRFIIGLKFQDYDEEEIQTVYKTPVSNGNYHYPNPPYIN
jgi:hypothetical protein